MTYLTTIALLSALADAPKREEPICSRPSYAFLETRKGVPTLVEIRPCKATPAKRLPRRIRTKGLC